MVNGDAFELVDHATVSELMHVREANGKIEGQDGYHDDHADAFILACWALRTCPGFDGKEKHSRRSAMRRRHPMNIIRSAVQL